MITNRPSPTDELFVFTCAPGTTVPLLHDLNTTLRGGIFCPIYRTWTRVGRLRVRTEVTRALIPGLLFVREDQFRACWDERHLSPMRRLNANGEPTGWAACVGVELDTMYSRAEALDQEFQRNPLAEDLDADSKLGDVGAEPEEEDEPELPLEPKFSLGDFPVGSRVLLQGGLLHAQRATVVGHKRKEDIEVLMDGARFPVVVDISSMIPFGMDPTAPAARAGARVALRKSAQRSWGRV